MFLCDYEHTAPLHIYFRIYSHVTNKGFQRTLCRPVKSEVQPMIQLL